MLPLAKSITWVLINPFAQEDVVLFTLALKRPYHWKYVFARGLKQMEVFGHPKVKIHALWVFLRVGWLAWK